MSTFFHLTPGREPVILDDLIEEGAGIGRGDVEQGDVERQLLRVGDGLRLPFNLARQADDEGASSDARRVPIARAPAPSIALARLLQIASLALSMPHEIIQQPARPMRVSISSST